ncbi:hypothetical protein Tco_0188888 [Tanacetum coccineum]
MVEDPKPPIDNSEARPLKEFIIKFIVLNVKKPLTLDFKTFYESTGLDYNQGNYVVHPSPKAVKAELAKIATKEALVNKTPVLKTSFLVAWRILLTFIVQGQRFVSYALEVLLGFEYTQDQKFRSLLNALSQSNFTKYASKVTPIELMASISMIEVINHPSIVTPLPCSGKNKKKKSQTFSQSKLKTQTPKASGALPQKRKNPQSKKTSLQAIITPPSENVLMEDSDKTQLVSSG